MNSAIDFTRRPCGDYLSVCGRFRISYTKTRPVVSRWTVTDLFREDTITPGYHVMYSTDTLTHCKNVAARWAKQHPRTEAETFTPRPNLLLVGA